MSNWYVRKPQSLEQRRTVEHHVGLCRALKADIAMFNIRHGSRFRNRPDKTFPLSSPQCQYTVEGPRGPNNFVDSWTLGLSGVVGSVFSSTAHCGTEGFRAYGFGFGFGAYTPFEERCVKL